MSISQPSTEVQRIRAYNFVKEKSKKWIKDETGKISEKFDKFVTTWQGYDKIRSRRLPKGLSTLMSPDDEENEGPFSSRKKAERAIAADLEEENEICQVIRNRGRTVRKMSCPTTGLDFHTALETDPEAFLSLPPIPIYMHEEFKENDEKNNVSYDRKLTIQPRRHSVFAFSPTDTLVVMDKSQQPRRSLAIEEEPLLSKEYRVQVQTGRRNSTKRKSKKKKIVSTETGAIMPAVLLTYQGGLFLGECESQLQNSTTDYQVSVC